MIYALLLIPGAIYTPYFPLWLSVKGFGPEEIAIILSAPLFLRVVTTPIITAFADKANDRANVLTALVVASLLVSLGYFLPPTYLTMLVVSLAFAVAWPPQATIADSVALSGVRRFGSVYANMRIWGSISFLCANFVGGVILAALSPEFVPHLLAGSLLLALAAMAMTPRLGRPRRASPLSAAEIDLAGSALRDRYFLLLMFGSGIIIASHGFFYGFASIYWKSIGISETVSGALWAWGVLAEVGVFIVFQRMFGHVSTPLLFTVAGFAAILRWLAFPNVDPLGFGAGGFFVVQTLHALSTGLVILTVQKLIVETIPEERTGAAQGIAFFTTGFGMATVTLLSGPLYDRFQAGGFYVMSGIGLIGLLLIGLAWLQPQRASSGGQTSDPS